MIYVLYSNDYEVYMGGNYRPEDEVLIEPTEQVLSACDQAGIPMTLFADVACFWRYRELGLHEFPNRVEEQLRTAIRQGHDVQAHLHPHWLSVAIERDTVGRTHYRGSLSDFLLGAHQPPAGETFVSYAGRWLRRCRQYLTELLCPMDAHYRCVAFRAGGYGLQPRESEFLQALIDSGFEIDSSVVPHMWKVDRVNRIDFRAAPDRANYRLSPESGLTEAADAGLFEIPIPYRPGCHWRVTRAYLRRRWGRATGQAFVPRGYGAMARGDAEGGWSRRLRHLLHRSWHAGMQLGLTDNVDDMCSITNWFIRRYQHRQEKLLFSLICHSKTEHPGSLTALRRYHERMQQTWGQRWQAITFQQAARLVASSA